MSAGERNGQAVLIRDAWISECGRYRYTLRRDLVGDGGDGTLTWVMLNPSTADASLDDPTIRRVVGFTKQFGYEEAVVVNLFAFRATDPKQLVTLDRHGHDVVGPLNDTVLRMLPRGEPIVCAWGANPIARHRAKRVVEILGTRRLLCLGTTTDGSPRHPLYVKGNQPLVPYGGAQRDGVDHAE